MIPSQLDISGGFLFFSTASFDESPHCHSNKVAESEWMPVHVRRGERRLLERKKPRLGKKSNYEKNDAMWELN